MQQLCASIYTLPEPQRSISARDLWVEMASDLVAQFGEQYCRVDHSGMRICLLSEAVVSPNSKVVRYRTIEASIRRQRNQPTLLDVAVGNLFAEAGKQPPEALQIAQEPQYAIWARGVAQVSLSEHVRLINLFKIDLIDAGWNLQPTRLDQRKIAPPLVENGQGVHPLPLGKFRNLVRNPHSVPPNNMPLGVIWPEIQTARAAADQLTRSLNDLFGSLAQQLLPVKCLRAPNPEVVNLVLLPDAQDLNDLPDLRDTLRRAEANGTRLKLAKLGSMKKPYPAMNIAYDMFLLAGGKPWIPHEIQTAFCSMDAGHNKEQQKSRWVKITTNASHTISEVQVTDTGLAEHIPSAVLNTMWPVEADGIICRDGKLSKEKAQMQQRADAEKRPIIESKKSPKAVLWRQSGDELSPAEFGDAVIDLHGELLMQTVPQSVQDYIHPVRLTMHGGDPIALATIYLHQQAVPGLSLFHMSRLPGSLYYADLISKLTGDGWPKAIGRGFKVPEIIP